MGIDAKQSQIRVWERVTKALNLNVTSSLKVHEYKRVSSDGKILYIFS